jgi:DDE superfamily endonuclease
LSPENRRSLTILESINAAGYKPIPPVVIVQGKYIMLDWWTQNVDPDITCYTSENGFTSNLLCIQYLKHFIKHTKSGPDSEWKVLLMDNHGSHETGEAIQLAWDNKILLYPFIAHLTHCMQPLDVGCFQPYKHWHDKAIKESLATFDVEYGIRSFFRDLPEIRAKTFKPDTIRHAFKDSGMWPISAEQCIRKLKVYQAPERSEPELPRLPGKPTNLTEITETIQILDMKLQQLGSSPTRARSRLLVESTEEVFTEYRLKERTLTMVGEQRTEELLRRVTKRKRATKFGPFTGADAAKKLEEVSLLLLFILYSY